MALTFNMHLFTAPNAFLLFGYLRPGRACVTGALQGEVESVMRKRLGRDVQWKGAFPAPVIWVTKKPESWDWPNPKCCGCGVFSREGGNPPATGDGRQLQRGWESKREIFLSLDKPPVPALQFQSPPLPRVSFHIREQISIAYGYKTWSGKEENPYFEGKEPTMGSANRLWSAWQDPDCFSSPAPRSDRSRAAALKALAPSSRLGFGVTPGGPRNLHLRPKTGGWEYAGLFWRLDDLR